MLPALLTWFKLVNRPFGQSKMQATLEELKDQNY